MTNHPSFSNKLRFLRTIGYMLDLEELQIHGSDLGVDR